MFKPRHYRAKATEYGDLAKSSIGSNGIRCRQSCEGNSSTMPAQWARCWRHPLSEHKSLAFCTSTRMARIPREPRSEPKPLTATRSLHRPETTRGDDAGGGLTAAWTTKDAGQSVAGLPGRKPSADIIGERTDDARRQPATDQDEHDDRIQAIEQLLVNEMNFLEGLSHGMHTHRIYIASHSTVWKSATLNYSRSTISIPSRSSNRERCWGLLPSSILFGPLRSPPVRWCRITTS
jgi:hypothetical protein